MKGYNRFLAATFTSLIIAAVSTTSALASTLATDNAGNYGGTWAGDLGSGWGGAWSFTTTTNDGAQAGSFIGDSTTNAGGMSGGINSPSDGAWGLYANSGQTSSAVRPFSGALTLGQMFVIDIDQGFQGGGSVVGLSLQNATGENLVEVYYIGGDAVDSWKQNDAGGQVNLSPNVGFTGNGLHLEITLTSATTYSGLLTPAGGSAVSFGGTLLNPSGGQDVTQVRLFNSNAGAGGDNNAFYNNIAIVPEPTTVGLVGLGLLSVLGLRRRKA